MKPWRETSLSEWRRRPADNTHGLDEVVGKRKRSQYTLQPEDFTQWIPPSHMFLVHLATPHANSNQPPNPANPQCNPMTTTHPYIYIYIYIHTHTHKHIYQTP